MSVTDFRALSRGLRHGNWITKKRSELERKINFSIMPNTFLNSAKDKFMGLRGSAVYSLGEVASNFSS